VTENPVNLTRSVKDMLTYVSSGGAPVFVWPGGGITFMVDVTRMPDNSFGYVPTPAIVAPIEFTLRLDDYRLLGGHMADVVRLEDVQGVERRTVSPMCATIHGRRPTRTFAGDGDGAGTPHRMLEDGRRLHLNHGPIDLIVEAFGAPEEVAASYRQAIARFETILSELVGELPLLRQPVAPGPCPVHHDGAAHVARHGGPSAAVRDADGGGGRGGGRRGAGGHDAGAELRRYVNNGGDIALLPSRSFNDLRA
jgi:hypothetical protein